MSAKDLQFASDLRTVVTRLVKKLRKKSVTGQQLSLTERSTLSLLLSSENGMLPSELAAMEKITNQSMSQILSSFLEKGFITRTASETDKRKVIISLTEKGKAIILQVLSERDEWLNEALRETCTEEERELIKKALGPLTKLVDFE
ncbi:MarR family winged helix-turn-helix transcriptional regulator [Mucilaginibacter sp. L196]|jgi:DNA-binding MarR family transcriptional regulator|uniref:MarR family winged helix-turn-helix transcriptional regulator n=1 Tax=Mucilaginibacter sp. L196 TaxID=1641870 RepID=UPI00131AEC67|nr:MarR family transcriptional regulator [Mucilaginibacter sp. L196]